LSAAPRAARIARAAALAAVVIASVFVVGPGRVRASDDGPRANGITIAYFDGTYGGDFRVRATLTLPAVRTNRNWYTDWIMLAGRRDDALEQPFVQVGLMRWKRHDFRLSSFVAFGKNVDALAYEDIELLPDGPHEVELIGRGETIETLVDGVVVRRIPRARVFAESDAPYVQVAAEVIAPGDAATGRIENLRLAAGTDALEPAVPRCFREDRGLRLAWDGRALQASGRFDPAAPSSFTGCEDFGFGDEPAGPAP
jgi:hypothetical protein